MCKKIKIILISGYAGSGKDTFGQFLKEELNKEQNNIAVTLAFATPIKECAMKYFNWDGNKDEKGRRLLQQIGRVGREYDKDIWIKKLIEKIEEYSNIQYFIITDWRFKNEYEYLEKRYGKENVITIRIQRNDITILDDVSEHDLDNFENYNFFINNNMSLEYLKRQAQRLSIWLQYLQENSL